MILKIFVIFLILITITGVLIQFHLIKQPTLDSKSFKSILSGVIAINWSIAFILSYFFPDRTALFRKLIWLCEHFSNPTSKNMAFFYSLLMLIVGIIAIVRGINSYQ